MRPIKKLLGQTFGRLTVLSRAPNPGTRKNSTDAYWLCQCQCGNTTMVRSYALTTGHTQSCGCLKLEAPHLVPFSLPKYAPEIAAARKAWRSRYTDLPFETFYQLAKMPCFYCDTLSCLKKQTHRIDSSIFTYNTLDRIDSSLGYTIDNIVPACLICNRAKLNRSLSDFINYMHMLCQNIGRVSPEDYRRLTMLIDASIMFEEEKYALLTSIKATRYFYKDGNITLTQFYQLTTYNCYYCLAPPANKRNISGKYSSKYAKETGTFIYNGLDRLDNNRPHDYDNVVPSCKYCNSAKNELSLQEFEVWIKRLQFKMTSPAQTWNKIGQTS